MTTKLPLSSSRATGLVTAADKGVDDQITVELESIMVRAPPLVIERFAFELVIGVSRLATQTIVVTLILLYHIPTYLFGELLGVKKPRAKVLPMETRTSPSGRGCVGVMVSLAKAL